MLQALPQVLQPFTIQIHTVSGSISNVNTISTGFAYQSAYAMILTTPGCAIETAPANKTVSAFFQEGGFSYESVNQCTVLSGLSIINTGGQLFDRGAVGKMYYLMDLRHNAT